MTMVTDLKGFRLFRDFTREQLAELTATARDVRYRTGERIFAEGAPAWGCWLIHNGHVVLDTHLPDHGRITVETLGAGDVLGWSWLVEPYRWHFNATAVNETSAILLDTDRLKRFADDDPALGYAMSKVVVAVLLDRLQATRIRMLDLHRDGLDA